MTQNLPNQPAQHGSGNVGEPSLDAKMAERLWSFYFQRMVGIARKQLRGTHRSVRDEEDVALSAFKSFCLGLRKGRFHIDEGEANLWPLLVTITLRKSVDQIRYENRQKRRVDKDPACSDQANSSSWSVELSELTGHEPTADQLVAATDLFEQVLDKLDQSGDPSLQTIALRSLEGESPREIGLALECTTRTIQRKLKTIAAIWEQVQA